MLTFRIALLTLFCQMIHLSAGAPSLDSFNKAAINGWWPYDGGCTVNVGEDINIENCAAHCLGIGDECGGFGVFIFSPLSQPLNYICYYFNRPLYALTAENCGAFHPDPKGKKYDRIVVQPPFIIGPDVKDWDNAKKYCQSQGSHLASLDSTEDWSTAKALCQENDVGFLTSFLGGYGCVKKTSIYPICNNPNYGGSKSSIVSYKYEEPNYKPNAPVVYNNQWFQYLVGAISILLVINIILMCKTVANWCNNKKHKYHPVKVVNSDLEYGN